VALGPEHESAAGAMLALAFRDNPINRAVIQRDRETRLKVNAYGMAASLAASRRYSFRRMVLDAPDVPTEPDRGEIAASLIALDPGGYPTAPPPMAMQLRCIWGQGLRVLRRWGQLYRLLDGHHPEEPHCYLALIATHPDRRHRGIGRALLDVWLRDVDARAMPSYLETDRSELLGFYQAAGFGVDRELEAFGRPVWCMSRPAQTRS
jgi:ribosomal protein S18 acetylase RimI-like enzyme